jgi:hypothetical protein
MKTLTYYPTWQEAAFGAAKKGDVFHVELNTLNWSAELRNNPPRIRLLEDAKGSNHPVKCEILDPWPGAPEQIGGKQR